LGPTGILRAPSVVIVLLLMKKLVMLLLPSPSALGPFDLLSRYGVDPWSVLSNMYNSMAPAVGVGVAERRWKSRSFIPREGFRRCRHMGSCMLFRAAAGVTTCLGCVVDRIVGPGRDEPFIPSPGWF